MMRGSADINDVIIDVNMLFKRICKSIRVLECRKCVPMRGPRTMMVVDHKGNTRTGATQAVPTRRVKNQGG